MHRTRLVAISGLAILSSVSALLGFATASWGGWVLGLALFLTCAVQMALAYTQRCPVCGKSVYIRENLPLETVGGLLTMTFRAMPEARCSRCQSRLD